MKRDEFLNDVYPVHKVLHDDENAVAIAIMPHASMVLFLDNDEIMGVKILIETGLQDPLLYVTYLLQVTEVATSVFGIEDAASMMEGCGLISENIAADHEPYIIDDIKVKKSFALTSGILSIDFIKEKSSYYDAV